jgi:hypothetical protein
MSWKSNIGGKTSNKHDFKNKERTQMNQISSYSVPNRYAKKKQSKLAQG